MKSKYTVHISFALVLLAHVGALAAVFLAPQKSLPVAVVPPTIQGIIVAAAPIEKPPEPVPPPPPPPQEQKPLPKPKIPLPKAPPSERAVKQEPTLEPTPPAPVEQQPLVQSKATPVTPPRVDANQVNNPAPVYPSTSKRLREEGTVLLEILVKADGSVGEMRLKQSSGYERLDQAALRAVKQWQFIPAKNGDEAIDFRYELPIEFSLNK